MTRYHDRLTEPLPGVRDMVRILREGGFRPKGTEEDAAKVPRVPPVLPTLAVGEASLTWVGHATYLLRAAGRAVLTDPIWAGSLPGRIPRLTSPGIPWEALPRIDAVVVSHNHYDHQDAGTFRRLPRHTPILVGLGAGKWFRRRGFREVHELDWWQTAEAAGLRFTFTPVHHWTRRGPFDLNKSLWGGWVVEAGGRKAFFGGDTGYGRWFPEIGRRIPGIEVAMLPIGAYAPRWFMRSVHMDPDEAVQALGDLGATTLATMHWGTFPLTQEPILEPLHRIRAAWQRSGRPREGLWDLALGESRVWGTPSAGLRAAASVPH